MRKWIVVQKFKSLSPLTFFPFLAGAKLRFHATCNSSAQQMRLVPRLDWRGLFDLSCLFLLLWQTNDKELCTRKKRNDCHKKFNPAIFVTQNRHNLPLVSLLQKGIDRLLQINAFLQNTAVWEKCVRHKKPKHVNRVDFFLVSSSLSCDTVGARPRMQNSPSLQRIALQHLVFLWSKIRCFFSMCIFDSVV